MNKVQFGLKNVYYSKVTWSGTTPSYATPVAIPGAVSLTLNAAGDTVKFYGDNMKYFHTVVNDGYEGTFECAKLPDSFYTDILGWTKNTANVLAEDASVEPAQAALLFQIDGDADDELYVAYNCAFGRPAVGSTTNTASKSPVTQTLAIDISPLASGIVIRRTTSTTTTSVKSSWFSAVYTG